MYENSCFLFLVPLIVVYISNDFHYNIEEILDTNCASSHLQNLEYKYNMECLLFESNIFNQHVIFKSFYNADSHFLINFLYHF